MLLDLLQPRPVDQRTDLRTLLEPRRHSHLARHGREPLDDVGEHALLHEHATVLAVADEINHIEPRLRKRRKIKVPADATQAAPIRSMDAVCGAALAPWLIRSAMSLNAAVCPET